MKSTMDSWRRALVGGAAVAALALGSCGGGEQVEQFVASRVIAFGDENSVILDTNGDANGRKYTVDAVVSPTDPTLACKLNPIWIQVLAAAYRFVFPECNPGPDAVAAPVSRIRAVADARVADLAAQIDAQLAEGPLQSKDLTTVWIGQNDVFDEYAKYPTVSEAQLTDNVEAIGAALGQQVNRLADSGAKVLISTLPDLGTTPFALAENGAPRHRPRCPHQSPDLSLQRQHALHHLQRRTQDRPDPHRRILSVGGADSECRRFRQRLRPRMRPDDACVAGRA